MARYRSLDPQTARWWQIDPEVEAFYAWSPYHSNLGNPVRYEDRDGDTPTLGPAVIAAVIAFGVDGAFQVGGNISKGRPAFENYSLSSNFISAGAAFGTVLTGGALGVGATPLRTVLIGAGTGGGFGGAESAAKQYLEKGEIDVNKTLWDTGISVATAGHGETAQQAFKHVTKNEVVTKTGERIKDGIFNTTGEVVENAGQGIADHHRPAKDATKTPNSSKPQGGTKTPPVSRPIQQGSYGTKVGNMYTAPPLY